MNILLLEHFYEQKLDQNMGEDLYLLTLDILIVVALLLYTSCLATGDGRNMRVAYVVAKAQAFCQAVAFAHKGRRIAKSVVKWTRKYCL